MLFFKVMRAFICLPALVRAVQGGKQVKPRQGGGSWRWAPSPEPAQHLCKPPALPSSAAAAAEQTLHLLLLAAPALWD